MSSEKLSKNLTELCLITDSTTEDRYLPVVQIPEIHLDRRTACNACCNNTATLAHDGHGRWLGVRPGSFKHDIDALTTGEALHRSGDIHGRRVDDNICTIIFQDRNMPRIPDYGDRPCG
jgi:hypothetical protein